MQYLPQQQQQQQHTQQAAACSMPPAQRAVAALHNEVGRVQLSTRVWVWVGVGIGVGVSVWAGVFDSHRVTLGQVVAARWPHLPQPLPVPLPQPQPQPLPQPLSLCDISKRPPFESRCVSLFADLPCRAEGASNEVCCVKRHL